MILKFSTILKIQELLKRTASSEWDFKLYEELQEFIKEIDKIKKPSSKFPIQMPITLEVNKDVFLK